MQGSIATYLASVQHQLITGHAQEHTYRPALETLFRETTKLHVINEPKGSAHGRPDFIFLKGEIPIAWVEAKDVYIDLEKIEKGEQMARYFGYANLILTNGLEFRFYKNGARYGDPIVVAKKAGSNLELLPETFGHLERTLSEFVNEPTETIRSAEQLAKIMGGKARRLRDNIVEMMSPEFKGQRGDIENVMKVIKAKIINDLRPEQFADLYAQTLVYGLFVARYNDDSPHNFSRIEAREKLPASNHLLQQFFDHIAGANFVKKLSYIVDELCDVFAHSNVHDLVHGLYMQMNLKGETHDPIIHFYEDFLREYDPDLRVQRGVFYTPLPVVRYIVRSVDCLLKEHFSLPDGLADRSQIDFEYRIQDQKKKVKKIDRVQILDPAVGTGTFLNEVIREIHSKYKGQEGMWPSFVNDHLITRLNGFELMMASYTIAHLKLSMTLAETGIKEVTQRFRVFLTNSLEEAPQKDDSLFAALGLDSALTEEAVEAAAVKRDLPIMVVMGNPPYSGISQNDGKWISNLIQDYLKEPGGKKKLNERKHWLNDDYVKFLRLAEFLVEKNGEGIVAMITNHGFLENPTFRGMRWHLQNSFNKIFIVDLHGNSTKKEVAPSGGKDENVFDIKQGVSIILAIRERKKSGLGKIYRSDLFGVRGEKYEWLDSNDVKSTQWKEVTNSSPNYFFFESDDKNLNAYEKGLPIEEIFMLQSMGITSARDDLVIDINKDALLKRIEYFSDENNSDVEVRALFFPGKKNGKYLAGDTRGWQLTEARKKVRTNNHSEKIKKISYRVFDDRYIYYVPEMIDWGREKIMNNLENEDNFALNVVKLGRNSSAHNYFVTNKITDKNITSSLDNSNCFPLYIIENSRLLANINTQILVPVLKKLGLQWIEFGMGDQDTTCGPEDIFDYIYAILHSPSYRENYKEFLKINFPRVPFMSDKNSFWRLVKIGRDIRLLHLMKSSVLRSLVTRYPIAGTNEVSKIKFDSSKERVFINAEQYFEGIDSDVWNFSIGAYQPLQKWLKDRKGRKLVSDDLLHYQQIVIAARETTRLMVQVDAVINENGGWPIND